MTHDYKNALHRFQAAWEIWADKDAPDAQTVLDYMAIRHALLGMHQLMQEPSDAMFDACEQAGGIPEPSHGMSDWEAFVILWEAMRDQMLAELTPALGGEV